MALGPPPYVAISLNLPLARSAQLVERVRAADAAGYDLFSLMDHPYSAESHEAYAALAFALGATQRIGGYVGVTNLPLRPAPVLARTLATLHSLSGGRVVLGLGSGGYWERIARFGVPRLSPRDAVTAFEEAIVLVKALSGGGPPVTSEGIVSSVEGIPAVDVPAPKIWTGAVGPRALGITGRLADGWIPPRAADWRSERYRAGRALIDAAAADAGRDPAEVIDVYNVVGALTPGDLARTRDDEGRWVGGSARQWTQELTAAVVEFGAGGFSTTVTGPGGEPDLATALRFAEQVVPAVHAARV